MMENMCIAQAADIFGTGVVAAAFVMGSFAIHPATAKLDETCARCRHADTPSAQQFVALPGPAFDGSVEVRLADARNKADLRSAIRGFDAVVNVIGGGTLRKKDVASTTSAIAVAAATEVGVHSYIAIS